MSSSRAEATDGAVLALLRTSLAVWGCDARVVRDPAGDIAIVAASREAVVRRAPPALPFRWLVAVSGRERAASSVTGMLRHLRAALDPDFKPARARIAALTLPPDTAP